MTLPNTNELIENFGFFDDWEERYGYLIDLGEQLPPMDDALKDDINFVKGCTSKVWMVGHFNDEGQLQLIADSDAKIVRGLIAVLMCVYNNQSKTDIKSTDINDVFGQLGLEAHLSPNRRNGFYAMVERVKALAAT
ncbi:MAG: SufE family protein [Pseudomonadota bacterium]|jgi:cysteine desulfuration protein SufE|nr:SufE family protein [Pseudomonadota bacterium]MEE3322946.1 SufE family protein [Pseudomonadota bacterium]